MGHSLFCFGLIGSDCNRGNCRLERNSLCLRGHDGAWPSSFFGGMRSRASASVQAPPTLTYGYALCGAPYLDASAVMTEHDPPVFWRDALPRVRECKFRGREASPRRPSCTASAAMTEHGPPVYFGGMRSRASASVQSPPTLTYG